MNRIGMHLVMTRDRFTWLFYLYTARGYDGGCILDIRRLDILQKCDKVDVMNIFAPEWIISGGLDFRGCRI